ncbi:MAG: 2,3-bisphosphoglycerate-independent phosphoglycerate mutase, partial [Sphaerochaetaceae bacterium]|nr:2,3-bisphosphoglycerate-independent phosphoglycerate mutase [Sphaerochaetaceae bacterium]
QWDRHTVRIEKHRSPAGTIDPGRIDNNAMGAGRVFDQGAKLVISSIETKKMYQGKTWLKLVENVKNNNSTLHFLGLLSDGNVHSNIQNLKDMIIEAKEEGIKKIRVHALLDGRDVGETSALDYFDPFAAFLKELSIDGFDAKIASGGGRMKITMDRYNANWDMVKKGWETHVLGEGRKFENAHDAIETLRKETGAIDQDLPPFVIAENGKPVGTIEDKDSVILFNFRGDRAIEISKAFEQKDLNEFDRQRVPDIQYAGMMEYDGDLHIPTQFLVTPPAIDKTMAEYMCATGLKQFSISETQKFGHVTYFFNGNKSGKFDEKLEEYVEIPSDIVPFEERPWMKCAEIADRVIKEIDSGKWDYMKMNFPNGDMVGHTGVYEAVLCSMEALDLQIERIRKEIEKVGGVLLITADHGNADDMYEHDKKGNLIIKADGNPAAKTSHSLNPVPFIVYDPTYKGEYKIKLKEGLGISSVSATCIEMLGYDKPKEYDPSIVVFD